MASVVVDCIEAADRGIRLFCLAAKLYRPGRGGKFKWVKGCHIWESRRAGPTLPAHLASSLTRLRPVHALGSKVRNGRKPRTLQRWRLRCLDRQKRDGFDQNFLSGSIKIGAAHSFQVNDPFFNARLGTVMAKGTVVGLTLLVGY